MRLGPAGMLGAAAFAVAGCGQLGAAYKGTRAVPASPASPQAIGRYPTGTPQRAVLEWFLALQEKDLERAIAFYAPQVRVTSGTIRFERVAGSRYFAQAQLPRIIATSIAGTRATVYSVVDFRWAAPNGRSFVYFRPQAFELQRRRGAWQLADNYFLESTPFLAPKGPCLTC